MIAFLTISYCTLIYLIFYQFKLLRMTFTAKIVVPTIGVVGILGLLIAMNSFQPYSTDLVVYQPVARIGSRVSGRVIEVPVQPNVRLKKGDVLYRVDPIPYQTEVDRLKAALAEAEQAVPQLKAALDEAVASVARTKAERDLAKKDYRRAINTVQRDAGAISRRTLDAATQSLAAAEAKVLQVQAAAEQSRLAYHSEIDGENTTVAQLRASLAKAIWELEETTVTAPADGFVTQVGLAPGSIAGAASASHLLPFVYSGQRVYVASFVQNAQQFIRKGDPVELAFDGLPGRVVNGTVETISLAMGQGQRNPTGELMERVQPESRGRLFVKFQVDDAEFGDVRQLPPAGAAGAAAVYTQRGKPVRIIRKVIIRMYSWLNYLFLP